MKKTHFALAIQAIVALAFSTQSIASPNEDFEVAPLLAKGQATVHRGASKPYLTVHGQKYSVDFQTATFEADVDADPRFGKAGLKQIEDGSYVTIYGEMLDAGTALATDIYVSNESYVEGASATYLRAIVSDVNTSGFASSDASVIDYSATLHDAALTQLSNGDIVEATGVSIGDRLLADSGSLLSGRYQDSTVTGIRGSSARGIRGSSARGIRGSSARGIRGSSARGIRGSSARGIRGSSARGIRGSSARGIRGSSARGIRGSSAR